MSPTRITRSTVQLPANGSQSVSAAAELRRQWTEPTDVISVLLLLGGEIVNKALAQLAGGWVSYVVTTLLVASAGDAKLMPTASEGPCLVITAKNGYLRYNASWVIGRILGDYESWMDPAVRMKLEEILEQRRQYMRRNTRKGTPVPKPGQTGLCISIYEPSKPKTAGEPSYDLIYWSGLAVATVQLAVAAIPFAISGDWSILVITVCGTIFAFITGGLPQWKAEKWACRRKSPNGYILTRGNGAQHCILILGNEHGLNLEDLAVGGQMTYRPSDILTRLCLTAISVLWIGLLIIAAGVKQNTWYLLAVGGIGIFQNVLVAGWRRKPSALGIHLEFRGVVGEMTTMDALLALESRHTRAGRSLLPIFFPGALLPEETVKWQALEIEALREKEQAQLAGQDGSTNAVPESWIAHAKTFERK